VLAAYAKAVGETKSEALRLKGTATTHEGKSEVDSVFVPGKFLTIGKDAKGVEHRSGFNGAVWWFNTPDGIQQVPLQYAIQFVNLQMVITGPGALPKLANLTGGTATLDGKDCVTVSGTVEADKTRVTLYFDKKTNLLARSAFYYPTVLGTMAQINDYSDYRKVSGVLVPMTVANHTTEGDTVSKYKSAKFDTTVVASVFDAPKK